MQTRHNNIFIGSYQLLISATAALLLLTACGESKQPPVKAPPPGVEVAPVLQQTIPVSMDFSGTVKAMKSIDIIPRVSGYIVKRYFTEGDYVEQGADLYLIDPKPYQASLDAVQAKLVKDQASVELWQSEVRRYTKLAKQGAASVERKEKSIAHLKEFEAAVKQDQADIDNAELQLGYTRITAPYQGRIQKTRINIGQLVRQQKDILTELVQMDPIYVIFNLSRNQSYQAQKLRRGGLGMQTLDDYKATIKLPDDSAYPHQGAMNYISAQVNPSTDTYEARALFPNHVSKGKDADLIPGQYTPLTLVVGEHPDALLIPQAALIQSQAGMHVYVLGKDNKVDHRKVEVGGAYQHYWVIDKGLTKGDKVIVKGVQKVKQGVTVTVVEPKSKDKPASAPVPVPTPDPVPTSASAKGQHG
jgi:membrane fusion protein (multidrug efflux system)